MYDIPAGSPGIVVKTIREWNTAASIVVAPSIVAQERLRHGAAPAQQPLQEVDGRRSRYHPCGRIAQTAAEIVWKSDEAGEVADEVEGDTNRRVDPSEISQALLQKRPRVVIA